MRPRVLVLDASIHTDLYRPMEHWCGLADGADLVRAHVPSGEIVPSLADFTHVIATGSEASITAPEPWFEVEAAAVREAARLGLPILGSCFGHQMLAWALAHPRHTRRSETPELGWIAVDTLAQDALLDGLPRVWNSFAFHFDEVVEPPRPWRVLARSASAAVQVMRRGDAPIWGIQAHPEIAPAEGRRMLEEFCLRTPERGDLIRQALRQEPRDDGLGRELVRRFLASSSSPVSPARRRPA